MHTGIERQVPRLPRTSDGAIAVAGDDLLRHYGLDPRFHRLNPDGSCTALRPAFCPDGHRLGPQRALVGGHVTYVSWECLACDAGWFVGTRAPLGHGRWTRWEGFGTDIPEHLRVGRR